MMKVDERYITIGQYCHNSNWISVRKDIADFDINYKLAPLPSMTSTHPSKPKKKAVDEQLLARYEA